MHPESKVTIATAAIGLLLLVFGVAAAWQVLQLQRSSSRVLDLNVSSIRVAERLEIVVQEVRHTLDRFLLTGDRRLLDAALGSEAEVNRLLRQAREHSYSESEQALVGGMRRELAGFFDQLRQVSGDSSAAAADSAATVERLGEEVLTRNVLASAARYLKLNEEQLASSNQVNKEMAERLATAFLLLGSCGAFAGLITGYGVARRINRSILQLSVAIRDVAGKLDEVVGPLVISADPSINDLEQVLRHVSAKVGAVVEQLHARHREVIRADQLAAVGQLAAGLAHELRNPLMSMKVLVQSAAGSDRASRLDARDLQVLNEEISRLENLLQAFLDFARPARLEKSRVDLAGVVGQTLELMAGRMARRGVSVECRLSRPFPVEADAAQIKQVVLNLLLNALDAVANGGKIWLDLSLEDPPPNAAADNHAARPRVCLKVADNGRGLPKEELHRLYEPFFSTKETGLGLGLAISQRIIQAHGGELRAYDREGGGAVFEFCLPSRDAERAEAEELAAL